MINRRKSSNPYITQGRLKFRLLQILLNALALLIIAGKWLMNLHAYNNMIAEVATLFRSTGGLAAYFRAYPTVRIINSTIIAPQRSPPPITLFNFTTKQPVIIGMASASDTHVPHTHTI